MPAIGRVCYGLKETAACADGVERVAYLRGYWDGQRFASHGDTYFTVPAFVRVAGKSVRGYVTHEYGAYQFHASKAGKNAGLIIPTTPKE